MDSQDFGSDPVHALAIARDGTGHSVWFSARSSGLYRSDDEGEAWVDAYATLDLKEQLTTASVATSPDFASDSTVFAGALGGILRSVDGGISWAVSDLPSPPPFVVSLVVSPDFAVDGLVFAATLEDGVFRSWDRGVTWASWNFGLLDLNVFCITASPDFAADDTLYVGTESGIFRSTNGGRAWRETSFPMDASPVLSLVAADVNGQQSIYAGTESQGVLWSGDAGETWDILPLAAEGQSINQLFAMDIGNAQQGIAAVLSSAVFVFDPGEVAARELWSSTGGAQISAAALGYADNVQALHLALSDGSALRLPLPSYQNQKKGDEND